MGKTVIFTEVKKVDEKALPEGVLEADDFSSYPGYDEFCTVCRRKERASDWEKEIGTLRKVRCMRLDPVKAAEKVLGKKLKPSYSSVYAGADNFEYTFYGHGGEQFRLMHRDVESYREEEVYEAYLYDAKGIASVREAYMFDTEDLEDRIVTEKMLEDMLRKFASSEYAEEESDYCCRPLMPLLKVVFAVKDGAVVVCEAG